MYIVVGEYGTGLFGGGVSEIGAESAEILRVAVCEPFTGLFVVVGVGSADQTAIG